MGYIEEKTGPMCSIGKDGSKLMFKMLVGGSKETFCELTEEEYEAFPKWDSKMYEDIKAKLLKA